MTEQELRAVIRDELSQHVAPRLVSVPAAARALGLAETAVWQLVTAGELRSLKVGRRRLIPTDALDEYVDRVTDGAAA